MLFCQDLKFRIYTSCTQTPLPYPTVRGQAEPWCWKTIPGICRDTLVCWCQKEYFLEITVPCRYSLTDHTAQKSPSREGVYLTTSSSFWLRQKVVWLPTSQSSDITRKTGPLPAWRDVPMSSSHSPTCEPFAVSPSRTPPRHPTCLWWCPLVGSHICTSLGVSLLSQCLGQDLLWGYLIPCYVILIFAIRKVFSSSN